MRCFLPDDTNLTNPPPYAYEMYLDEPEGWLDAAFIFHPFSMNVEYNRYPLIKGDNLRCYYDEIKGDIVWCFPYSVMGADGANLNECNYINNLMAHFWKTSYFGVITTSDLSAMRDKNLERHQCVQFMLDQLFKPNQKVFSSNQKRLDYVRKFQRTHEL